MRTVIKYGLGIGLGMCAWHLAEYFLGFHSDIDRIAFGRKVSLAAMLIPIFGLVFGLKELRESSPEGRLRWIEALRYGLMMSLLAGLVQVVYHWIYLTWIHPDLMQDMMPFFERVLTERGLPAERIAEQLEAARDSFHVGARLLRVLSGSLTQGALFSALAGLAFEVQQEAIGRASGR